MRMFPCVGHRTHTSGFRLPGQGAGSFDGLLDVESSHVRTPDTSVDIRLLTVPPNTDTKAVDKWRLVQLHSY